AAYTSKLRRHIIPCLLESNYAAEDWLGVLFGEKIYIDFDKQFFDDAMKELVGEILNIEKILSCNEKIRDDDSPDNSISNCFRILSSQDQDPLKWNSDQVEAWLSERKLELFLFGLSKINGRALKELLNTKHKHYDHYRSDMLKFLDPLHSEHERSNLILRFSADLEMLFEKH
ncbi:unnamed protein product, partial [Didymodactylos carnosus]